MIVHLENKCAIRFLVLFHEPNIWCCQVRNGSGKATLLKILAVKIRSSEAIALLYGRFLIFVTLPTGAHTRNQNTSYRREAIEQDAVRKRFWIYVFIEYADPDRGYSEQTALERGWRGSEHRVVRASASADDSYQYDPPGRRPSASR